MATGVPHIDEQRQSAAAFDEGRTKARALPAAHLVKLIRTQKEEADHATEGQRALWSYWWDLWLNRVDYADKEDWQTQIWVPKVFSAIEHATSLIQRSLLDSGRPFGVEGKGDQYSKNLATHGWQPRVELAFEGTGFAGKFTDLCKFGFVTGVAGYLKFRWQTVNAPTIAGVTMDPELGVPRPVYKARPRSFLAIEVVEPWKIFRDPHSRPRENFSGSYLIHSEWKQRPELVAMVRRGWNDTAVQALLATKGSGTGATTHTSQEQEARRKDEPSRPHAFRQPYLTDEWWGDVLDENGDAIMPDGLMIASGEQLLAGPAENPLWAIDFNTGRRKWPFIAAAPLYHPTRFEGRGIAEQDADLARLFSNLFCLFADGLNWRVNPETEIWQDALADWEDLAHYPGKLWIKKQQAQALMPANTGNMPTGEIMQALEYIDRQRQNSNFVNDFVLGSPGSRSQITLGEVEIKTNESHGIFETIAKNLELGGVASVELAQNFLAQFLWDFSDPAVLNVVGERNAAFLMQLPLEERIAQLQGQFTYKFTGVSQALYKGESTRRLVQFAQLAASAPYADILQRLRPVVYLKILTALRDMLSLEDRIELPDEAEMQAALDQQAAAGGMPGATPPGGPGPSASMAGPVPASPAELLKQRPPATGGAMRALTPPATAVPNPTGTAS